MPGGDGMGPMGRRNGSGFNRAGPIGNCVCPRCGRKVVHRRGVPCNTISCPQCGVKMTRG